MKEIDKLRNYFLNHFQTPEQQDEFHLKYWIPLEIAQPNCDELENNFRDFLLSKKVTLDKDLKFYE